MSAAQSVFFVFFIILPTIGAIFGGIALWTMRSKAPGDSSDWTEWQNQEKALKKKMKEWK